ncbi:hypothetical protein tinsulaeT_32430 [Thalassotalea insulae]|uniref:DUF5916 domain-containing protein n=1 Tax=Thalassotalea insulae TaxID=2056778 RepID=A0ABQ6GVG8_9GAMM|nr:DUF5916 domain-containing protein [Thalassotalea insulae]GLX79903.1 hypothetical protein tinsulaeT_32430 [Thalassotalea insulae]
MKIQSFFIILTVTISSLVLASIVQAKVVIDGKLMPDEWRDAQVFSSYVQSFPNTGETPKYPTTTYLLTDEKGIYIGFENYQPERSRTYSGHDQYTSADFDMVFIDFNNDGDTTYEFVATLGGGTMDGTYSRGNQSNRDWDGTWQVQVSEQGDYWYSEFFIPWTTATYQEKAGDKRDISVYFQRYNVVASQAYSFPDTHRGRKNFTYEYTPVAVDNYQQQSLRSTLYLADQYDFVDKQNEMELGLDLTWKPKANHQLIATINPDFGQVESDELIVNYSAVETLRTDKRPFFTENQSLFDVQGPNSLKLVNTRRIGANAQLDAGTVHDIIAAGKYIYNGSAVNAGVLYAQEDDAVANDGKKFTSARWYSSVGDVSFGQLANFVDDPLANRDSLVVNHDVRYQLNEQINLFANAIYSHNQENLEKNIGKGLTLKASYVPERYWQNALEWSYLDDALDINDLGYQQRNNLSNITITSQYDDVQFSTQSLILRGRFYGEYHSQRNTQGLNLRDNWYASYYLQLKNKHAFRVGVKQLNRGNDDLITRQLGYVTMDTQRDFHLFYDSPSPAVFSFDMTYHHLQEGLEDWANKFALNTTSYFSDSIRLDANYTYIDSDDWLVGNASGQVKRYRRYLNKVYAKLVARLDQHSDFTLTTQWYGVKAKGRSVNDSDFFAGADFNVSRFALQARYRYKFNSGSSFYLVYGHNGFDNSDENGTNFSDLLSNAVAYPEQKSLTAKVNWIF